MHRATRLPWILSLRVITYVRTYCGRIEIHLVVLSQLYRYTSNQYQIHNRYPTFEAADIIGNHDLK